MDEMSPAAQMIAGQSSQTNETITVASIEDTIYQLFQRAAFQKYKQSVINYGSYLWREARSVAHQRDPDATVIEITTPDVEAATVRVDMKLSRLRRLRFPYRLVQLFVTLATGVVSKIFFDLTSRSQGSPGTNFLPWVGAILLFLVLVIVVLNYFEMRAEVLR